MAVRLLGTDSVDPGLPLVVCADNTETILGVETDHAVTPASLAYAFPYIDVRSRGATGDGTTNDATAIQAACNAATATAATVLFPPGNYNIATTGIVAHSSIRMLPGARLTYAGTGIALLLDATPRATLKVDIRKTAQTWSTGADTTSIGLRVRNSDYVRVQATISNFWVGLDLHGDQFGTSYGVIDCITFNDNMKSVRFSKIGTGWANQHEIRGQVRINSGPPVGYPGTRYIDMSGAGNNITFINMTFENNMPELAVECATPYNLWLGCRWETSAPIRFTGVSTMGNMILGGYANLGPGATGAGGLVVQLTGGALPPTMISSEGSYFRQGASGSQQGVILYGATSSVHGVLTARSAYGSTPDALRAQLTGGGRLHLYRNDGMGAGTFPAPVIDLDAPQARLYIGDGTVAPTTYIAAASATITQFVGQWRFPTAPQFIATGINPALWLGTGASAPKIFTGTGSPEAVVTAGTGSLFLRTDGGAATTLYVKETGSGLATGWVPK